MEIQKVVMSCHETEREARIATHVVPQSNAPTNSPSLSDDDMVCGEQRGVASLNSNRGAGQLFESLRSSEESEGW